MASIRQYVHFKDTPDVDELCPHCHNPALRRYVLQEISLEGITPIGERIGCTDCRKWLAPVKEYAK